MAERIVSPGVFTREKDLSFLPVGIGEIGAALIGQTVKGPAFVPTRVESFNEYQQKFGGLTEDSYLPYTAQSYLEEAGAATIVRVLGSGGYTLGNPIVLTISSSAGNKVAAVLHPSTQIDKTNTGNFANTTSSRVIDNVDGSTLIVTASNFSLSISGSGATLSTVSASLNPSDANYLTKTYGYAPKSSKNVYTYLNFSTFQSASFATGEVVTVQTASFLNTAYTSDYSEALTPWIVSQRVGGSTTNLFKFHTLSHGTATNYEFKVGIRDIKPASEVPGSEYGTFSVIVRRVDTEKIPNSIFGQGVDDSDTKPNIVEEFTGLNLDPNSPNYIKRVIGDKYITVDANGKLSTNGDYNNASVHIRVEVDSDVDAGSIDSSLVPFGFAALTSPLQSGYTLPDPSYVVSQSISSEYNKRVFLGYNYDFSNTDNLAFLNPVPASSTTTVGSAFNLADCHSNGSSITLTSDIDAKKFIVPFQGGFDGWEPNRVVNVGSSITAGNTQGLDCTNATSTGTVSMRKAINAVSNPDEFDINMVVTPGMINRLHSSVTTFAKDMCEDRLDCFYVMDGGAYGDSINVVVNSLTSFDSNYVATYHPWCKILDTDKNKPVWVPPSVVLPGVIAFSDSVGAEWYAPAGLNRGGLPNVIEVETRLTHDERDTLYTNRINPIATFPAQGVTVFGQKTLQARPSALDRINVRRLLIAVKKYIASSTRYLVFENNTAATRNRFLSIVNPYLESIQQRNGLYAFRVVMDDSNNTPDVIDRNIMVGEIYLQPAKTAEFIVLDFNILPTGAAFPEA
jgi:phage tail sheath protein FI